MKKQTVMSLLLCVVMILSLFTGCHGAKERVAFQVPEEFDTSKTYEEIERSRDQQRNHRDRQGVCSYLVEPSCSAQYGELAIGHGHHEDHRREHQQFCEIITA